MSGFKDKTWRKWKEDKTTSPVTVIDKKTADSIPSQRSSSLIRSKKRQTIQNATTDILAAGFADAIIIPKELDQNQRKETTKTDIREHRNIKHKNDLSKTTSPFNTLGPTHPFNRENILIVHHGEVSGNSGQNELWGELPSTEVAESPKSIRKKGPKGGTKRPILGIVRSRHKQKPSAPPSSPVNERAASPLPPQASAGPPEASGPSRSPAPRSGPSHYAERSPDHETDKNACDSPECPTRGTPKQKERLCMAPECPVTLKKAVVKEARKAMKRSCGKKRKNPLTTLRTVFMNTFAGHDLSCKLTKEEKKALKRMRRDEDRGCNTPPRSMKSKGVQCKPPKEPKPPKPPKEPKPLKDPTPPRKKPEKVDKSTTCNLPDCPIVTQKMKIREFLDKEQLCDIQKCLPVKEPAPPPPRKEKKVEPPKGCPAKPCHLKPKDEEFLQQLAPCIFEKLPRLKLTCDQALAEDTHGRESHPAQHNPATVENRDPHASNRTKDRDKGVTIVTGHVHVSPPSDNPFMKNNPNSEKLLKPDKAIEQCTEDNKPSPNIGSEGQKLLDRNPVAPFSSTFGAKLQKKFEKMRSNSFVLVQIESEFEDESTSRQLPRIRFHNQHVNRENSVNSKVQFEMESDENFEPPLLNISLKKSGRKIKNQCKDLPERKLDPKGTSNDYKKAKFASSSRSMIPTERKNDPQSPRPSFLSPEATRGFSISQDVAKIGRGVRNPSSSSEFEAKRRRRPGLLKFDFSTELRDKNWPPHDSTVNQKLRDSFDFPISTDQTSTIELLEGGCRRTSKNSNIRLKSEGKLSPAAYEYDDDHPPYVTIGDVKSLLLKKPIATDSLKKIKPKFSIENTEVEILNEGSYAPRSRNLNAKKQFKHSVQKKLTNDIILNENFDLESLKRDKKSTDIIFQQHNIFNSSLNKLQSEKLSAIESSKRWTDIAKASNEIQTQTLATSAISPTKVDTIGVGSNSKIYPEF